ncbi:DUF721 domain-containing protein [Actinomadura sp. LOL_016]|uniref:DUF721 domain-containing protein n=1 Tax=unclassified Actinomadura TaxID=2626254 RepID=UPI003A80D2BA
MGEDPQDVDGADGASEPGEPTGSSHRSQPSQRGAQGGQGESGNGDNPTDPTDPVAASGKSGIELAREALAQAKADALKRGTLPGHKNRRKGGGLPVRSRDPGRGGDPKPFGAAIRDLMATRGWEQRAAVGGVFGNWAAIVGPELAEHTRPEHFEDGELTIAADSATWATQLRLLSSNLVRRLNLELGHGTVRRVKVIGPSSGPRRGGAWRAR